MTDLELESWTKSQKVSNWQSWLLPQMVAHFGSWQLKLTGGRIDVRETVKVNCSGNPLAQSMWRISRISRSQIVKVQTKTPEYGALVPLVLLGFKRMQGIPYSRWQGLQDLRLVLEPRLLEALDIEPKRVERLLSLGSDTIIELRSHGLMHKGTGKPKNPQSTWSLTGMENTELGGLPKITQSIITQIWLAHPQVRHSDMILDLKNWDHMPEPLVKYEVFQTPKTPPQPSKIKPQNQPWVPPWEETL